MSTRDYDTIREPIVAQMKITGIMRHLLDELKISKPKFLKEIIEDRKRIDKVWKGWKRRRNGKFYEKIRRKITTFEDSRPRDCFRPSWSSEIKMASNDAWMMSHIDFGKKILRLKNRPKVTFSPKSLLGVYSTKIQGFKGRPPEKLHFGSLF